MRTVLTIFVAAIVAVVICLGFHYWGAPKPPTIDTDAIADQAAETVKSNLEASVIAKVDTLFAAHQALTTPPPDTNKVAVDTTKVVKAVTNEEVMAEVKALRKEVREVRRITASLPSQVNLTVGEPARSTTSVVSTTPSVTTTTNTTYASNLMPATTSTREPLLASYVQDGKTYVSMRAVIGSPPYYRYGGHPNTTGWTKDDTPLMPSGDWIVMDGVFEHFQIISSDQQWSQVCETYNKQIDLGVYIEGNRCEYLPVQR